MRNFNVIKLTQNKSCLQKIYSCTPLYPWQILNKQSIKGAHREDCPPKFPWVFPAELVAAFAASPSVGSASF